MTLMHDRRHSAINTSIHLRDQAMSLPIVLGPVGMAGMYSSRGEVKAANAAKGAGVRGARRNPPPLGPRHRRQKLAAEIRYGGGSNAQRREL